MPHTGPGVTERFKEAIRYDIPSQSFGITADDAAETLVRAEEIKANKPLMKEVKKVLVAKKKALDRV